MIEIMDCLINKKEYFKLPNCTEFDGHFKLPDYNECEDHFKLSEYNECDGHFRLPDCKECEENFCRTKLYSMYSKLY